MDQVQLDASEASNLRQIEALNQRGGRTLSIVDVMRAGTITPEAAGFLLWRVAHGASFLTGAVPGGAGKSTLLADLLAMLPPGERIVTTPDAGAVKRALAQTDQRGRCYLCHEIGAGHWYGYLWGETVAQFLSLAERGGRIASCLHADEPDQMRRILLSPPLCITEEALGRIGLLLFMAFDRTSLAVSRVVSSIWSADDRGGHRLVYQWHRGSRTLQAREVDVADAGAPPTLSACRAFMARLAEGPTHLFEDVRRETIAFYERED